MAAPVKGQATLDAANERKANNTGRRQAAASQAAQKGAAEANDTAVAVMDPAAGFEKPKTLRQLEQIVESNALRGGQLWRKAADALMVIRSEKLWKKARDEKGEPYPSFVVYAEQRFGFKKTYAYDLVKAATRKPEAITERSAREEMAAERAQKPITREKVLERMQAAFDAFENKAGDLRDRSIDDADFVRSYDVMMGVVGDSFRTFIQTHAVIAGEVALAEDAEDEDAEANEPTDEELAAAEAEAEADADLADGEDAPGHVQAD